MNMRRWGVVVLAAALVGGGCGTDEELEKRQEQGRATQKAFAPIKAEMAGLGSEIGTAIKKPADAEADVFEGLEGRMEKIASSVAALDVPESELPERDKLSSELQKSAAALGDIAEAAGKGDAADVRRGISALEKGVAPASKAQKEFEGALRHLTGQG